MVPKPAALEACILIVRHSLRCIALESQGENEKVFVDFTDTSNVNEVGPPAQVLLNPDEATRMQQQLPSWTVTSNGQLRAKAKKVCWEKLSWKLHSTFGFALSNPQTVLG
jgi:hypothetical protein